MVSSAADGSGGDSDCSLAGGESIGCVVYICLLGFRGGGPRVVVSTAAFHARVPGSFPGLGGLKEKTLFLPHPLVKHSIVESLCDREVACSASDLQGLNFKSCVWRAVSSDQPREVLLAQFSMYVHKSRLTPDSFHFIFLLWFHTSDFAYSILKKVIQAQ